MEELICFYDHYVEPLSNLILGLGIILGVPIAFAKHIDNEYKKVIAGKCGLNKLDTEGGLNGSTFGTAFTNTRLAFEEAHKPPFYLFFLVPLAERKLRKRNEKAKDIVEEAGKKTAEKS